MFLRIVVIFLVYLLFSWSLILLRFLWSLLVHVVLTNWWATTVIIGAVVVRAKLPSVNCIFWFATTRNVFISPVRVLWLNDTSLLVTVVVLVMLLDEVCLVYLDHRACIAVSSDDGNVEMSTLVHVSGSSMASISSSSATSMMISPLLHVH
jgi:hypothetical protein